MRNSTIIALGLGVLVSLPAMGKATGGQRADVKKLHSIGFSVGSHVKDADKAGSRIVRHSGKAGTLLKMSDLARQMKPGTTKTYGWDGEVWTPEETYTYTYDAAGNVTVENSVDEKGMYARTVNQYDSNGMLTFKETKVSDDGVNYKNSSKSEMEYDPILTDVITKKSEWRWDYGKWQQTGDNYECRITRNEDGNVTSVVTAVLLHGTYDLTERLDVTYGEDGKAVTVSKSIPRYDGREYYWEDVIRLSDIEWENTDGQIHDIDMLFTGNNRIKSAHYEDFDGASASVSADYMEDGSYTMIMDGEMEGEPVLQVTHYTTLENEGYRKVVEASIMGVRHYELTEEVYDEWGHLLLSRDEWSVNDELKVDDRMIGEVEVGEQGFPVSYTISESMYDLNTGETYTDYSLRTEYYDYIDVALAVEDLSYDRNSEVRYYDMPGHPVDHPSKGSIVIRRQGSRAAKIIY
ncbi:MAG: hypothetical protein K2H22_06875 [Muribaculaceae bacterium]|nr:hypothetical protein [Muribaculaceae bacterium]